MTTIAQVWEAFLAAIAEARTLHASGGSVVAVADLLQHARELVDIIDDEVSVNGLAMPDDVGMGSSRCEDT